MADSAQFQGKFDNTETLSSGATARAYGATEGDWIIGPSATALARMKTTASPNWLYIGAGALVVVLVLAKLKKRK